MFFLTKTYLYPYFVIWNSCLYLVLSHYFDRKECFYTTYNIQLTTRHTRQRFWKIVCLDRRVCTQVLRLRTTDHEEDWHQRPGSTSDHHDWPRQSRRLTMKNDWPRRLTTIWLHHFDLWGRVRVQLLTYVLMSGWKVSIVLLSANTLWVMFAVKKDVSVRIFWHTSPWLCAVSSIISHWFTRCDVSLQNFINCETWRRASFH